MFGDVGHTFIQGLNLQNWWGFQCKKTLGPNVLLCTVFKKIEAFLNNIFLNFCEMNNKHRKLSKQILQKNINQLASKANLKMLKKNEMLTC